MFIFIFRRKEKLYVNNRFREKNYPIMKNYLLLYQWEQNEGNFKTFNRKGLLVNASLIGWGKKENKLFLTELASSTFH